MHQLDRDAASWRETTLDKWSGKTQGVSTANLGKKLNNAASPHRPLVASINETLSYDQDRLIIRTRTPRSMAPGCTEAEHPEIFDDADFYQLLLKALVDRRMVDGGAGAGAGAITWTTAMRDSRKKKVVDTKASKGRKLRYQVQEKIQNFMAPLENNTWHEQQIEYDPLFYSTTINPDTNIYFYLVSCFLACWAKRSRSMKMRKMRKEKIWKWMVCGYLGVEENLQLDPDRNVNLARQSIFGVLVLYKHFPCSKKSH